MTGWACEGVAYRVPDAGAAATLAYLRARELVSDAYAEARLPVELADGPVVEALAYVSNPEHAQYCGGLSLEAQAEVIARAVGPKGRNLDYLFNTVESLEALGLHDPELARLAGMVRERPV
jgi:cation transport protein ChaC